jgi:chromosome segregation ATPase
MKNVIQLVSSIEKKVKELAEEHEKITGILHDQKTEIEGLKKINEELKGQIKTLEEKLKLLKIAKATDSKEGAADAKRKINEIVREIDKCIGLLNT